ncbi:hypothetical protein AnigIFM56816_007635 [Aspergillus niger]|nr:hypothetical protein AnigIFM56816_007635 [Aspergillus niger]
MAGTALSVLGLIQPTVIDLLRKGMQNRDDINKLLRNESTMEIVIRGLKEMLDGLEGNGSSDGSDDFLRELFDEFKKSVRALHGEMQQIRETYRNDQSRLRFLGLLPQDHRRSRKLRKLQDHFTDVVEKTDLMRKCAELITRQGGGGGGSGMHVDPVGVDTNSIADTPRADEGT